MAASSRIWVEGRHDAELLEHVWGDDLREAAIVVEPMHGIDDLVAAVAGFGPSPRAGWACSSTTWSPGRRSRGWLCRSPGRTCW